MQILLRRAQLELSIQKAKSPLVFSLAAWCPLNSPLPCRQGRHASANGLHWAVMASRPSGRPSAVRPPRTQLLDSAVFYGSERDGSSQVLRSKYLSLPFPPHASLPSLLCFTAFLVSPYSSKQQCLLTPTLGNLCCYFIFISLNQLFFSGKQDGLVTGRPCEHQSGTPIAWHDALTRNLANISKSWSNIICAFKSCLLLLPPPR